MLRIAVLITSAFRSLVAAASADAGFWFAEAAVAGKAVSVAVGVGVAAERAQGRAIVVKASVVGAGRKTK